MKTLNLERTDTELEAILVPALAAFLDSSMIGDVTKWAYMNTVYQSAIDTVIYLGEK